MGSVDYSGLIGAATGVALVLGSLLAFILNGLRRGRLDILEQIRGLSTKMDTRFDEMQGYVDEEIERIETDLRESTALAIRAEAKAEALQSIFGQAMAGGGRRWYEPPRADS